MDIRNYIAILWRRKWVIAVTTVITATIALIGTLRATPIYTASTTLRVFTAATGSIDWIEYNIHYADRLMNTYAELATSGPVLENLMRKLGLDEAPQIGVQVVLDTELIKVTVQDPSPILAREAANALAEILVAQSKELYSGGTKPAQEILGEQFAQVEEELNQARKEYETLAAESPQDSERIVAVSRSIELKQEIYATLLQQYERSRATEAMRANTLSIVEPAATPWAPSKPRKMMNMALGFMVGLAGGVGLAFLIEHLDTTLYTTEQIEETTALSTLAKVPSAGRRGQVYFFDGNSPQGEALRRLRTNIFTVDREAPLHTLVVTSAEPQEGKSTIVASLACTMAQSARRVIVVDADLRRPTLHKIFDLPNEIGLSSLLQQDIALEEAVQDSKVSGVQVLTSGPSASNPVELLGSQKMAVLIKELAQQFDVVLLDTPALAAVTDAAVLAPVVDGVLLVVGQAQARKEAVQFACQQLADVKARSVSVIVNRAERDHRYSYYRDKSTKRG
jgi:succinoglycan biosynthesis transport protein ExoP